MCYVTLYLLFKVGYQFVGEVVIACNVLYGFPFMCPSFFRKWQRDHSVDVITVSCEFMSYRVIGEVVDGDVSGSVFSVDVNFQLICIPNNTKTQKIYLCIVLVRWIEL